MTHGEPELLVADSFRVRAHTESGKSEVRNFHQHLARFKASAIDAWQSAEMLEPAPPEEIRAAARKAMETAGKQPPNESWPDGAGPVFLVNYQSPAQRKVAETVDAFLADARKQINAYGVGWPRFELWGIPDTNQSVITDQQLRLSLRQLPELGESLEARTIEHPAVVHPERKGPNIALYTKLNKELDAEALLTDESNRVIEGSTTSLMWWRDGTLCVSEDGGRIASVTEYALRDFANSHGIGTQRGNEHPSKLACYEVWAVNALHGIRIVTSIDGVGLPAPDEDRLRVFQAALDATWQPVSPELN